MRRALGTSELNAALREVVAGIWFELEPDRDRLLADFKLRSPVEWVLPGGVPIHPALTRDRMSLPPMRPGTPIEPRQTGTDTFLSRRTGPGVTAAGAERSSPVAAARASSESSISAGR